MSDVKASGTAGGSSVAGTQTRTLNTLVDTTGIVTSLSANQFILPAGTYDIQASASTHQSNGSKLRLRNITDGTTLLLGSSVFTGTTISTTPNTILNGQITISSPKTLELQHYIAIAKATDGLGLPASSGESEVYAQIRIEKIR